MLQLLFRSKLIVQLTLISVVVLVSIFSRPSVHSEKETRTQVRSDEKDSLLFQVGFIPSDTSQSEEMFY